jgi:hypothetical protein
MTGTEIPARQELAELLRDDLSEDDLAAQLDVRDELADVLARGEPTWDLAAFEADFDLVGYCEPVFVIVRRRADLVLGTLWYAAYPRRFFGFHAA